MAYGPRIKALFFGQKESLNTDKIRLQNYSLFILYAPKLQYLNLRFRGSETV